MPVLIKLRTLNEAGDKIRSSVELNVDYPDAASLPATIRYDRRVWERTGGANSTNYRREVRPVPVDLEEAGKIIEV